MDDVPLKGDLLLLVIKNLRCPLIPCVRNEYHGGRLSGLTLREMQQEGVWGETQDLSLQMLKVHMCGEFSMIHHCEPLNPDIM